MDIIEVSHLTKNYGSGRGVFDVSFSVHEKEVFGFLGPNGAGKSTTIRHIMGFSKPISGSVKIFNNSSFENYYKILQKVGYIPGEIALPVGLSGYEFIRMMQDLQGIRNDAKLKEMLDLFKLEDNVLRGETKRMSLGVKRKLAIVVAFMHDPTVLILDEPTSGLDPVMQQAFIQYIKKEKARGKTILLSSHIFSEVEATCDTIAIIKDGKIVSNFIADELKHASFKYYTVQFENQVASIDFINANKQNPHIKLLKELNDTTITFAIDDIYINEILQLLKSFPVIAFDNRRESLEDYFMKFYKEDIDYKGAIQ